VESDSFYFDTPNGQFPAFLMSAGHRKLGALYTLIRNGLVVPGNTLLWDEPESHLSPLLLNPLVGILRELAISGVQIFLATHSYELLNEIDLQVKYGGVNYFALDLTASGVSVNTVSRYEEIIPNKISDEFDSLFDRVITRATGRPRK